MNATATAAKPQVDIQETIYDRLNEILLKLLDGIASDIADGRLPSAHLTAYEALCRSEAARRGR